jgi:hypothetical protein
MNSRTITVQGPFLIPEPTGNNQTLKLLCSDSGFVVRWVPITDCQLLIRPKTGEKRRITTSLMSNIKAIDAHDKTVLTFEELLVSEEPAKFPYLTWKPEEWFEYTPEESPDAQPGLDQG